MVVATLHLSWPHEEADLLRSEPAEIGRFLLDAAELEPRPASGRLLVGGPVEVVVREDGWVRGVHDPWLRGWLDLRRRARRGEGLRLYVQRETALLKIRGGEPSNVTVAGGALVSVRPAEGGFLVIADRPAPDHELFAPFDALGPDAPPTTATSQPLAAAGFTSLGGHDWDPCWDVVHDPARGAFIQRGGGVAVDVDLYPWDLAGKVDLRPHPYDSYCGSRSVVLGDSRGLWRLSAGYDHEEARITANIRAVTRSVEPESFAARLRGGDLPTLTVMTWRKDRGIACEGYRAKHARMPRRQLLTGTLEPTSESSRLLASTPFGYESAGRGLPSGFYLACVGCRAPPFAYSVVWWNEQEAHLVRASRHPHVVAYDVDRAERWFLSPEACESALQEVTERHREDPGCLPRLGLHATLPHYRWVVE